MSTILQNAIPVEVNSPPTATAVPLPGADSAGEPAAPVDLPVSDAFIVAGLAPSVLTLSAWLLAEKFRLGRLAVFSTVQGVGTLREAVERSGLPAHERLSWHGEEVDGSDGEFAQRQFLRLLSREVEDEQREIPLQLVLGGGVNWMIAIAAQLASLHLEEPRGDGLWILKTDPLFEHHPGFLRPDDAAVVVEKGRGFRTAPIGSSRLMRVPLARGGDGRWRSEEESLHFVVGGLSFLGRRVTLPPLLLCFYRWLLLQTKQKCSQSQRPSCFECSACALPAKHGGVLAKSFEAFYRKHTSKPGYVQPMKETDFQERIPEYVSKINLAFRQQTNIALYRQLIIEHGDDGYLPAVDKNLLRPE